MKEHNIKIDEIKLTFASIDQFNRWKNGEEKATKTYFSKTSSSNNIVYSCSGDLPQVVLSSSTIENLFFSFLGYIERSSESKILLFYTYSMAFTLNL